MRILGIDPALTVTGYGVIDTDKRSLKLIEAGIVKTNASDGVEIRLDKIHQALESLVEETKPNVMVLEKIYSHYRHPTTSYLLGQARGVICLIAAQKGIPLVEYAATRIKKAIVGRGLASKHQVQRMVMSMLNIDKLPAYTDVTDALALAIAHGNMARKILK